MLEYRGGHTSRRVGAPAAAVSREVICCTGDCGTATARGPGYGRKTYTDFRHAAHTRCMPQAIQRRRPRSHTIVEAHPDVHARMLQQGWDRKPRVRILFGRWQDVLPESGLAFDGIFWDTFSEYYEDMQ